MPNIELISDTDSRDGVNGHALLVDGKKMTPIQFQLAFSATDIRMVYDLDGESDADADVTDAAVDPLTFESKLMLRAELDFGIDRIRESLGAYSFEHGGNGEVAQMASLSVHAGAEDEQKVCVLDWFNYNNTPTLGITVIVPEREFSRMAEGLSQGWFDRLTVLLWDCPGIYSEDHMNESRRLLVVPRGLAESLDAATSAGVRATALGPAGGISLSCTRAFKLKSPH